MQTGPADVSSRQSYAAMLIGIAMMTAILWMPSMLGAFAVAYGLGAEPISHLAFGELVGFLCGTLLTHSAPLAAVRRWAFAGCLLILCASAWMGLHTGSAPSVLLRLIAGLGAGFGFGYGLKACATSAHPTRNFGLFTGSMSLLMIIGFQSVAHLLEPGASPAPAAAAEVARAAVRSLALIYVAAAIGAAMLNLATRMPASEAAAAVPTRKRALPSAMVLTGLLAIALAFVGQGGIWAFLQILGVSHGYSVAQVANGMSAFALIGIAGSLTAAATPARWPRWAVVAAVLPLLWCGLYFLYAPWSLLWYVIGCAIGGFYWNYTLPLILGLLARIDRSGQGAVLGGTMSSAGSALGPLVAGLLIHGADYRPVGMLAAALCLLSTLCVAAIERYAPQ
jgi:predicted MFS family arabinose efflux permease